MGSRWIAVKEESSYGVKPSWASGVQYYPFIDGEPVPNNNEMDLRESIYLPDTGATMGGFVGEHTLRMFARPDNLAFLLKWAMGQVTELFAQGMYKHTFTMAEDARTFSAEHYPGVVAVNPAFLLGCVVKSVEFEASQDRPLIATWTLQYRTEDLVDAVSALGTLPAVRPFTLYDATVTSFGEVLKCESFRLRIERTIPDDAHVSGSRFLPNVVEEGFEITGELEGRFEGWSQKQRFFGTGAPSSPAKEYLTGELSINCDGPPSGQTYDSYDLIFTMPKVGLTAQENPVGTRDRLMQRLEFKAFYDATMKIELYNLASGPPGTNRKNFAVDARLVSA